MSEFKQGNVMSIFTMINESQLKECLSHYDLGELVQYHPFEEGTVNSNYYVETTKTKCVLTIIEKLSMPQVLPIIEFTNYLQLQNIPCPFVYPSKTGALLTLYQNKPIVFVSFIEGKQPSSPSSLQCQEMGRILAKMHRTSHRFTKKIPNSMGWNWMKATTAKVLPKLSKEDGALLTLAVKVYEKIPWEKLPKGIIHADLFRNNAFFKENALQGIIDFYYACYDSYLYDLAITVNEWCRSPEFDAFPNADENTTHIDELANYSALFSAYKTNRELTELEKELWQPMLVAAGARFWLSRLHDALFPKEGVQVVTLNPDEYKRVVLVRLNQLKG